MKCKRIMSSLIIFIFFLGAGCSMRVPQSKDTVVPPVAGNLPGEGLKSSSSLNNISNMTPLAQPSTDMVYTLFNKAGVPVSINADNKYLYLLRSNGNTRAPVDNASIGMEKCGNIIEVYDVENGSLVRKITDERLGVCSAFTVKDSNLYAFDMKTGCISLLSSRGSFLSAYDTGLSGVYADKIVIADNRRIVLSIRENQGENTGISVFNPDTGSICKLDTCQLCVPPSDKIPEISDFCLFGEKSVIVGLSCRRLSLIDIEKEVVEKSCVFPMSAGFMEFDGNVLYYASDEVISLSPGNAANFSNISSRRQTGRMLINSGFTWPESEKELVDWLLNNLTMPVADSAGRHFGMAQNTKYLFFLDFLPEVKDGHKSLEQDFMMYRIPK